MLFPTGFGMLVMRCLGSIISLSITSNFSSVDSIHSFLSSSDLLNLTVSERRVAGNPASDRSICRSRILRDTKFGEAREAGRTAALGWDMA